MGQGKVSASVAAYRLARNARREAEKDVRWVSVSPGPSASPGHSPGPTTSPGHSPGPSSSPGPSPGPSSSHPVASAGAPAPVSAHTSPAGLAASSSESPVPSRPRNKTSGARVSLTPSGSSPPQRSGDTPTGGESRREQGLRSRVAALEVEIAFVRDAHAAEVKFLRAQLSAAQAARDDAEEALASALGVDAPAQLSPKTPVRPPRDSPRSSSVPLEQLEQAMDALLTLHPELRVSPDGGAPRPRTRGVPSGSPAQAPAPAPRLAPHGAGSPYEKRSPPTKPRKTPTMQAPTPRTRARAMEHLRELTLTHQQTPARRRRQASPVAAPDAP